MPAVEVYLDAQRRSGSVWTVVDILHTCMLLVGGTVCGGYRK